MNVKASGLVLVLLSVAGIAAGQQGAVPPGWASGTRLPTPSKHESKPRPSLKPVLIIFEQEARTINLVAELRVRIERTGGNARHVIGVAAIIADIDPRSMRDLAAVRGVQAVYDGRIETLPSGDGHMLAAVAAWNRLQARPAARREPPPGEPPPRAQPPDASKPLDLPDTLSQLREIESAYQEQWQELKGRLPPPLQRSTSVGCGINGAGYFDTSLYFAGDIAVGVVYLDGTSGGWTELGSGTTASTAYTFADIVSSLNPFISIQPNARIVFTYINEVDNAGSPLPAPTNERMYVNQQRDIYCTDWAFLISVLNGGLGHAGVAWLHGPSMTLDRTESIFDYAVGHEAGHIMGAFDQYSPVGPAGRYGYLMAANANACGNDGSGFFSGAGECLDDLMAGWTPTFGYNSFIGPFTANQFGWHDSGGRGVPDVINTKPVIDGTSVVHVITCPSAINCPSAVTYSGVAFDRPLLNELGFPYGNVSINSIIDVEYRINSAAWQDAAPSDGVFDSVSEGFHFTTPGLRNGTYSVQIRAFNAVGAVTPITYAEQLAIAGSTTTNNRPFGSLMAMPDRARFNTPITLSGSASRDLDPGPLEYSWKWGNSSWTSFLPSPSSTSFFATPGTYTVQMRVRDQGGLFHLLSRTVIVEAYDTAPVTPFVLSPENRHFTPNPSHSLSLSVGGARDAETPSSQLKVDWDTATDCKGPWPNQFGFAKVKNVTLVNPHYPRSDRRCVRARVTDGTNVTEAEGFGWVVPYNHPPSIANVTFTPTGLDYIVTVNATDPDALTNWGGVLEYRFDFQNDGIWDTTFDPNPTLSPLLAAYRFTLAVEAMDPFFARARWVACSTTIPSTC